MKYNWVDIGLGILILLSFYRGYRAGFLKSIFSMIGYVGGGVLGLAISWNYLKDWDGVIQKFAALILAIAVGSAVGQMILIKFASFFHKKMLFGPFKWLDSLLGAAFSVLRIVLMAYLIAVVCLASPWQWADKNIPDSKIYQKIDAYTPMLIKNVTDKITEFKV
ncbi:CvpA Uncharacterized membrane protein, required for colicin V production [actinobacterium SCGC AAA044-D11]|jgi:uncharacterized membrane protein required for colicin V production